MSKSIANKIISKKGGYSFLKGLTRANARRDAFLEDIKFTIGRED